MWQEINKYPENGDYVKAEYKGKVYEGTVLPDRPVMFRTGYVAKKIITKTGQTKWMPWSSRIKYYKEVL